MDTAWAKETPFPGQPAWLTNVLVRDFARDWVEPFGNLPSRLVISASDAAADAGIPPRWLLDLSQTGIVPSVAVAHAVVQAAIAMGPPQNAAWDTLVTWRAQVLGMVYDGVFHAA